jgi:hypothetical protein
MTTSTMTTKKPRLTIYLTQEKRDYLEQWSEKDKRTLSNLVGLLIDEAIERRQKEEKKDKETE